MHFDKGNINNVEVMENGMLRIFGTIAKVGWLEYRNDKGDVRLEYVPEETLFDNKHLDSIGGATLTLNHPPESVNPLNYKKYTVGATGTRVVANLPKKCVDIVTIVCDEEAIKAVTEQGVTELSMGYDCETELISDNKYRQIKRVCNHNAIVDTARCQGAKLHIDSWVNTNFLEDTKQEKTPLIPKFKVVKFFC